jgi:uncharacterized DUF497 family protein
MRYLTILWDMDDDPDGNVQHIAEHGLSTEEVEEVLGEPADVTVSQSSGLPLAFGQCSTGKVVVVVYEEIDPDTARPITAHEVEP